MDSNGVKYEIVNDRAKEKEAVKAIDLLKKLESTNAYGVDRFRELLNQGG